MSGTNWGVDILDPPWSSGAGWRTGRCPARRRGAGRAPGSAVVGRSRGARFQAEGARSPPLRARGSEKRSLCARPVPVTSRTAGAVVIDSCGAWTAGTHEAPAQSTVQSRVRRRATSGEAPENSASYEGCTVHSAPCTVYCAAFPRLFGPTWALRPARPSPRGQGRVCRLRQWPIRAPRPRRRKMPHPSRATRRPATPTPQGDRDLARCPRPREMPVDLGCTVGCAAVHCPLCSGGISSNRKTSGLVRRRGIATVHTGVCSPPLGSPVDLYERSPQRTWSFRRRPRSGTRRAPQPGPEKDRSRDATGRDRRCAGFHHSPPPPPHA